MSNRVNGTKGAHQQPLKYGISESGRYTVLGYEGTKAEIAAKIAELGTGVFFEVTESFSGAKDKLEARYPSWILEAGSETPVDDWEFFASEAEKDLLEADNDAINAIAEDDKRKIRNAILNPTPGVSPALVDPNAISVYLLMLNGLRSVRVLVPALRHSQTVSSVYTVKASLTNVRRIISTNSMILLESIPSTVLFNLPNDVSTRDGLSYGWYKKHPTIRLAANQRAQIVQEWEYGLWPPLIMGAVL